MKTPTTLADLVLSAQAAANKAFEAKDPLGRRTVALEEFSASGLDRADFPNWESAFYSQLDMLEQFSRQDSPATQAAKKATAAKPA